MQVQQGALTSGIQYPHHQVHSEPYPPINELVNSFKGKPQTEINELFVEHLKSENDLDDDLNLLDSHRFSLTLTCQNKDGLKQETTLPILAAESEGYYQSKTKSLQSIKLPVSLQKELKVSTVQDWFKKISIVQRIDVNGDNAINVNVFAFSSAMPVSHDKREAYFTPEVQGKPGDTWAFLTYDLSGDNWGERAVRTLNNNPLMLQANGKGKQEAFALSSSSEAQEMDKLNIGCLVVVGVRLVYATQLYFNPGETGSLFAYQNIKVKSKDCEATVSDEPEESGEMSDVVIANDAYFKIANNGHFMALVKGVPVNLESQEKNWVEGYLNDTKTKMKDALEVVKENLNKL